MTRDELLGLAARDVRDGARAADVVEMLVRNGVPPEDAAEQVFRLVAATRRSTVPQRLVIGASWTALVLGAAWWSLEPVPDWRATLHWSALAVGATCCVGAGLALLAARPPARAAQGTAIGAGAGLAVLALLAWLQSAGSPVCSTVVREEGEHLHLEELCRFGLFDSAGDCEWSHRRVYLGLFLGRALPDQVCACG